MYLGSFMLDVVFSDPRLFVWPVTISFCGVAVAAVLYTKWSTSHAADYHLIPQQTS